MAPLGGVMEAHTRERIDDTDSNPESDMDEYEVTDAIAPPPGWTRRNGKYPWPEMSPGDSFTVPINGERPSRVSSKVGAAGRQWCERHRPDCTVIARTVGDEVRAWLVERE